MKPKQEASIRFAASQNLPKVGPILQNSKAGIDILLKVHMKNLPWIYNDEVLVSKLKRYQKQWSVGRMSKFLSEFKLDSLKPGQMKPVHLFRLIKSLRRLVKINLGLRFLPIRSIVHVKTMIFSLKRSKNLTSVDLSFILCQDLTSKNLKRWLTQIKSLRRLRTLKVTFGVCLSQGLKDLSQAIRRLSNLLSLHLTFQDTEKLLGDDNIKPLLTEVGKLRNLSEFNLSFMRCSQLTKNCLQNLAVCLKKLGSLTRLTLALKECSNIGNQGLCHLFNQLKNCRKLNRVVLHVNRNSQIDDTSLITLGSLLKELEEITNLDLEFSFLRNITEDGWHSLFRSLEYLKKLKFLQLNLFDCAGCTDKTLVTLACNMKTWISLSEVTFDFQSSSKITGDGIKAFCIGLKDLKSVSKVSLISGWYSSQITYEVREVLEKLECQQVVYNRMCIK